jgi:hypothetical protein
MPSTSTSMREQIPVRETLAVADGVADTTKATLFWGWSSETTSAIGMRSLIREP